MIGAASLLRTLHTKHRQHHGDNTSTDTVRLQRYPCCGRMGLLAWLATTVSLPGLASGCFYKRGTNGVCITKKPARTVRGMVAGPGGTDVNHTGIADLCRQLCHCASFWAHYADGFIWFSYNALLHPGHVVKLCKGEHVMNNLVATRFRMLLIAMAVLSIGFTAFASWRESGYIPNRSESKEATALLTLAVKSLMPVPAGQRPDHLTSSFVKSLNESRSKHILESLSELDEKLEKVYAEKRLKSRYSVDLDRLSAEIRLARREEKALYGSDFDIAMAAIQQLKIGRTLSQLTWKEDLPQDKRASEYWDRYVARADDGFLGHKNPWGPLYGSLLVRETGSSSNDTRALLRISGGYTGRPADQGYEDVRKNIQDSHWRLNLC